MRVKQYLMETSLARQHSIHQARTSLGVQGRHLQAVNQPNPANYIGILRKIERRACFSTTRSNIGLVASCLRGLVIDDASQQCRVSQSAGVDLLGSVKAKA
jgi:hypothetical protein